MPARQLEPRPPRKVHHILPMPRLDEEGDAPFGREVSQEVGFLIELMDLKANEAILDVAAGAGRHALELARRGFKKVTALDLSDQLLDIGKRCAAEAGLDVSFVKGDARKPATQETFDAGLILGGGAFGLMENDGENQAILDATFEALRPGGRVALSAMNLLWLLRHAEDLSQVSIPPNSLHDDERARAGRGRRGRGVPAPRAVLRGFPATPPEPGALRVPQHVIGFGADAGRFSSRSINTESPQILLYALKPKA